MGITRQDCAKVNNSEPPALPACFHYFMLHLGQPLRQLEAFPRGQGENKHEKRPRSPDRRGVWGEGQNKRLGEQAG